MVLKTASQGPAEQEQNTSALLTLMNENDSKFEWDISGKVEEKFFNIQENDGMW